MIRLSIPGNACVHCGAIVGKPLACSGCGHVDPLTRSATATDEATVSPTVSPDSDADTPNDRKP